MNSAIADATAEYSPPTPSAVTKRKNRNSQYVGEAAVAIAASE
jgi:hypothetical protein